MVTTLGEAKGTVAGLSDGIPQMPRRLTPREVRADTLYLYLQIISRTLFIATAMLGFQWRGSVGCLVLLLAGWYVGSLMRHSMGMRNGDPSLGFFIRMQERANGSRPGILERLIENLRGNPFTREKCARIAEAFQTAEGLLAIERSDEGRDRVLRELDAKVKAASYGD